MTAREPISANGADNFANDPPLRLAKRELRWVCANPRFWIGLAAVLLVIAVAGPFGTADSLSLPQRVLYWSIVGVGTFFVGLVTSVALGGWLYQRGLPEWAARLVGGSAAGLPVTAFVLLAGFALHPILGTATDWTVPSLAAFTASNVLIAAMISVLYYLVNLEGRTDDAPPAKPDVDPLLDRLPPHKRGPVLRLGVEDHYTQVVTTRGTELVLMRLSDAAQLMGDLGLRIHRSHWVARDAVRDVRRDGSKLKVELRDGTVLPVGRTYEGAVRGAGLATEGTRNVVGR